MRWSKRKTIDTKCRYYFPKLKTQTNIAYTYAIIFNMGILNKDWVVNKCIPFFSYQSVPDFWPKHTLWLIERYTWLVSWQNNSPGHHFIYETRHGFIHHMYWVTNMHSETNSNNLTGILLLVSARPGQITQTHSGWGAWR